MYCEKCGGVLWHDTVPGYTADRGYCHKCDPPEVKILPLEVPTRHDISEEDLRMAMEKDFKTAKPSPTSSPVNPSSGPSGVLGMTGKTGHSSPIAATGKTTVGGAFPPSPFDSNSILNADGVPILAIYEDLPKNASQGAIAYIQGQSAAYVFDGDDWQNLGAVARSVFGRDAKCDRRAAVAATKAKDEDG